MVTLFRGPPGRPQTFFPYHNSILKAITLNTYTEILPIRRKMLSHKSMISNSLSQNYFRLLLLSKFMLNYNDISYF